MKQIEFIEENFLGMSYTDQIKVIEYLMSFLRDNKIRKLTREFDNTFEDYLEKLKSLLSFKVKYQEFNSDKRRLFRKIVLEKLQAIAFEHRLYYSDEGVRERFIYTSEYYGEYKRYFEAKQITCEEVQNILTDFSNLTSKAKIEFINEMIFAYSRINRLKLPYPEPMLNEYKSIIQNLLGEELMIYYDKLFTKEKMELILELVTEFRLFNHDEDYYNYKLNTTKENPQIIRLLKRETINRCQETFS